MRRPATRPDTDRPPGLGFVSHTRNGYTIAGLSGELDTVEFTNNEAERSIRPVKVQMRSSGGCWRTLQGLTDFALVHSYLSTAAKWGLDKLDALHRLFTTGPWLPPALAPPQAA